MQEYQEQALYDEKMRAAQTELDFSIMKHTNAKVYRDGDMYCCLYGDNLQEGISGFGETPYKAVQAFNQAWNSKV